MKIEEAKRVIREDPDGNIMSRIEAIKIALCVLGDDATMQDIWKWAEEAGSEIDG